MSELVELHTGDRAPPELRRMVFEETEGNAFFVVEVLRHLAESGLDVSRTAGETGSSIRLSVAGVMVEMQQIDGGWWTPSEPTPDPTKGDVDYGYLIDDADSPVPDPRSRRQPAGVHQRSRTYDPSSFSWTDSGWRGRQLAGSLIYELHVGTFTPEGTLDAALGRLDHLRSSASTSSS